MHQPNPRETLTPPTTDQTATPTRDGFEAVCRELRQHSRFLLTSHARPDGDSIGSQLALAFALESLGKSVRMVNADPPPLPYMGFPGVGRIEVAPSVDGTFDAVVLLECGDLARPGVAGLERYRIVNVDHHDGNTLYGAVNWFDPAAAACTEVVAALIDELGVAWSVEIATHIYLGILTDTGGFQHSNITARTFELCRRTAEHGVNAARMAAQIYTTASVGRLRLLGSMLDHMRLEAGGRLAVLYMDDALLTSMGATVDDTEGIINVPLSAKSIEVVVMLKGRHGSDDFRVSLRSKGDLNMRAVAQQFGGGGHFNASGCTVAGPRERAESTIVDAVLVALAGSGPVAAPGPS